MKSLLNDSNFAKYPKSVFVKDSYEYQTVYKNKSLQAPAYLADLGIKDLKNIIVLEDGNLIYDNLVLNQDDLYLNDFDSAKEEMPNEFLKVSKEVKDSLTNNLQTEYTVNNNSGGVFLLIHANKVIDETIHIINYSTRSDASYYNIVVLENGAKAKISEYHYSSSDNNYSISLSDVVLKNRTTLKYHHIINQSQDTKSYHGIRGLLMDDSKLDARELHINSYRTLVDEDFFIKGSNVKLNVDNVAILDDSIINNTNITIRHMATDSTSEVKNIAITKDKAEINYNINSIILKDMNKSKAIQKTTGVILSNNSKIAANPFLTIDCYDVEASHGATIGKFSDDDIFYLMSRGLTQAEAEDLIVSGIIKPYVEGLGEGPESRIFQEMLRKRMGDTNE